MSVPIGTVRRLLLLSAVGYLVFTVGTVGAALWWQDRTSDRIDAAQQQTLDSLRVGLVEACERGNTIRRLLAEDNAEAVRTTLDLLDGAGLSSAQRRAYRRAVERREQRQTELVEYPCERLGVPRPADTNDGR